ncbi:MAG: hypothetical protein JNK82_23645 [Myxococcaceae bacterium]|nr:hypothetical protein [Myxococcaceae bacterium]
MRPATVVIVCALFSARAFAADEDVDVDTDQDRIGRVAAELGAGLLGAALPQLLWAPYFVLPNVRGAAASFLIAAAGSLTPLSVATSVWLVHRKMKGQGYWASAFGGAMFGTVVGAGAFALYAVVSNFGTTEYIVLAGVGGAVLMLASTAFMIELHHDRRVSASFAPTPGGAFGAITVRF